MNSFTIFRSYLILLRVLLVSITKLFVFRDKGKQLHTYKRPGLTGASGKLKLPLYQITTITTFNHSLHEGSACESLQL